ncbi:MAG TPA: hypothetical protein VNO32_53420 [Candidatus Acidoferrum sp.]|jgi:hypothetical protein|nr:hypothetical protein [Candidatus Acidoferrum sp.]
MFLETFKKQLVESEQYPRPIPLLPLQPVPEESVLAPNAALEDALDSDALSRLRILFELLDDWDQKEKTGEK